MVKLFSRTLLLLGVIGLGMQEGKLFGMQQNLRQRGAAAEQQVPVILNEQEQRAARIAELEATIKLDGLLKKSKEIDKDKRDEEVQARAKIFKGLLYGLLVPGAALINYNMGNFGVNQCAGIFMLVVLSYYGVIQAFLVCLSEGVQHIKQIPVRRAINYIRHRGANVAPVVADNVEPVVADPFGAAFDSDSDSDLD
ncbi:hypothetical protein JST56_00735 [Candidatus Dependentiae bacterium]|nr:hypothetical protein [Candidatus Dependentiae bacterium]